MKYVVIVLAVLAGSTPAFAGYHCYNYQGQLICCNTMGNTTYCN